VKLEFTIIGEEERSFIVLCAANNYLISHDVAGPDYEHAIELVGEVHPTDDPDRIFLTFEAMTHHGDHNDGFDATFRAEGSASLTVGKKTTLATLGEEPLTVTATWSAARTPIQFDFSSDPGLRTETPDSFTIADGKFKANSLSDSQQYGTFTTDFDGGSFVLEFDIRITERTTGDTNIGFFSASRKSNQPSPGGDPTIHVIYGGYEKGIGLRGFDADGVYFDTAESNLFGPFKLNVEYHNKLTYNAASKNARLVVTSPAGLFFDAHVNIPGGLPALPHVGVSSVGSWASRGRQQRVEIDNLSVDNASLVNEDSVIPNR